MQLMVSEESEAPQKKIPVLHTSNHIIVEVRTLHSELSDVLSLQAE